MQLLFNYVCLVVYECPGREASPKEERHISSKKECSLLAGGLLDFFPVIILLMSFGAKNYLFDCKYTDAILGQKSASKRQSSHGNIL